MARQRTNTQVIDRIDGQPAIILANGNWGQWSNEQKKYVDSGVRAYPEDDANNVKYFILSSTSTTPSAPTQSGGWSSVETLNAALEAKGWSPDPLSVSAESRFQFMAVYGKEMIPSPDAESGTIRFTPRFTLRVVGLFNNYAPSPVITFDETKQTITITNPDGSSLPVKIPTPEAVKALSDMVTGLKKQVDKAVYQYEGEGAPTMDGTIVMDWLEGDNGKPITDDHTKADIFGTHLRDVYFDKRDGTAYRFELREGGDPANPADYGWVVVKDTALSAAIARIAEMEGETAKIWTETPTDGDAYKVGDLLVYKDTEGNGRYKVCIKSNTPPQYLYSETDWVEPYATMQEVADLRKSLQALSTDLSTAKGNIADLTRETGDMRKAWDEVITDGIVVASEKARLETIQKQLDTEQAQLQSNVNYILESRYYKDKDAFRDSANRVLAPTVGTLDKLQSAIAVAVGDSTITKQEIANVNAAFDLYTESVRSLSALISTAQNEIDNAIPKDVKVGGRNLIYGALRENYRISSVNTHTAKWIFTGREYEVNMGEDYVLSFSIRIPQTNESGKCVSSLRLINSKNGTIQYIYIDIPQSDKFVRLTFNLKFIESGYIPKIQLYNHRFTKLDGNPNYLYDNDVEIKDLQIELGTVATDYTEAPEDVEARYQSLIESVDVEFSLSSSPTVAPTSGWQTTAPEMTNGKYLWQRTKTTLKNGTISYKGETCIQGKEGKGINSVIEMYYHSDSMTELSGGTWQTSAPTPSSGKWIWTRSKTIYSDGTEQLSDPICVTGDRGKEGKDGQGGLSFIIHKQGEYRTTYRTVSEAGQVLPEPQAVKRVEGGVNDKVVMTAQIFKGTTDVTERAKANGGAFIWYLNGNQIASGTERLELGVGDHVDGKTDNIEFSFDDTKANEW